MMRRPRKDTFRQLPNVVTLVTLIEEALETSGAPLACYSGPSGFGKTEASIHATLMFGAAHIECEEGWSYKYFLEKLAAEQGLSTRGTSNHIFDRVRDHLKSLDRMLLIDDAHFMTSKGVPRLARSFADKAGIPVILIGEEMLPNDLASFPDVLGRIAGKVAKAAPASLFDITELGGVWLPGVVVTDPLKEEILLKSQGSLRAVREMLERIEKANRVLRRKSATVEDFGGDRLLAPNQAPRIRSDEELGRSVPSVRKIA